MIRWIADRRDGGNDGLADAAGETERAVSRRSTRRCFLLPVLLVVLVAGGTACSKMAPSPVTGPARPTEDGTPLTRLIAAMPPAVESVWVQDLERLLAEESIFRRM